LPWKNSKFYSWPLHRFISAVSGLVKLEDWMNMSYLKFEKALKGGPLISGLGFHSYHFECARKKGQCIKRTECGKGQRRTSPTHVLWRMRRAYKISHVPAPEGRRLHCVIFPVKGNT
jgi:hypothetical protein